MDVVKINMDQVFRLIGLKEILQDQAQNRIRQLEAQQKTEREDAPSRDTNGGDVPGPKNNGRT